MEKAQIGAARNSEISSTTSYVNIKEVSKKKEELIFPVEEGDDEDVLSDDSLRLQLSDDEDAEQDVATNDTNRLEFKAEDRKTEQLSINVNVENIIHPDSHEIAKKPTKPSSGEEPAAVQKEPNSAIKIVENSALPSNEHISEDKRKENNIHNLKNSSATVNESSEKCTLKSNKDLKITKINNTSSNATSEQPIGLKNDNLSTNSPRNIQNAEVTIHSESSLKETVNDCKEINTCKLNKLDNTDGNSSVKDNAKVKISKNEKLSTVVIVPTNNDDNSSHIVINKAVINDNSVQHPLVEINSPNCVDLVKSHNLNDLPSTKDSIKHKKKNEELKDITQSKNLPNTQSMQEETNTSLKQDKNNLPNKKDKTEVTNGNYDKPVNKIVDNKSSSSLQNLALTPIDVEDSNNDNDTKSASTIAPRAKRSKKVISIVEDSGTEEDKQEGKESGRYKRKTAKNAEEIIRKKYLNSDSDSSDAEQIITMNHKVNRSLRLSSPPPLRAIKRPSNEPYNGKIKILKMDTDSEEKKNDVTKLTFVEKFFQRDAKEKIPKLTQEELEELLIQKITETLTMRCEIGQLREQARISEKTQEAMRGKVQQLTKQVKDFKMVLDRNAADRRLNSDKPVAPIKINRSVGLQVNFITEHGMQNLRQVQQTSQLKPANAPSTSVNSPAPEPNNNNNININNNATNSRRGIKIRSPRSAATASTTTISQSPQTVPLIPTVTPAALVVAKPVDAPHTLTLSNQSTSVQPVLSVSQQQIQPQHQIVVNGKIQNHITRPQPIAPKTRNSDLIDLTDEEEKNKSTNVKIAPVTTAAVLEHVTSKPVQGGIAFQRVIQTLPANVAIAAQPTNIRVIAPNQSTPTALVNNINPPRLTYVMQTGSPRQVLIANTNQQIRPATTCNRSSFPTVTYQTGTSTITNGTVRVITTPALSNIQISKHPAPLPDTPNYTVTPNWKLPPPAPSLKISKVANGIVLSWNMNMSDKYAEIASYQLYAYQEVPGVNPSTSLWKKVGDVRALPLPMACTLTQFSEGNNYYFAVRAVDTHSRKGQYSVPGNISL